MDNYIYEKLLNLDNEITAELNQKEQAHKEKCDSEHSIRIIGATICIIICLFFSYKVPNSMMSYYGIDNDYRESKTDVIITQTGECYHNYNCSSNHGGKIHTTLLEAKNRGYRSCRCCNVELYEPLIFKLISLLFKSVIPFCFISLFISNPTYKFQKRREKKIDAFRKTSVTKITSITEGKSIHELCALPSDIYFESDGFPYSKKTNYVRFTAEYGKVYHDKCTCCRTHLYKQHIFSLGNVPMCMKCGTPLPSIPDWYDRYKNIVTILNKYGLNKNSHYNLPPTKPVCKRTYDYTINSIEDFLSFFN